MLSKPHRLAKTRDVKMAFARGRGFFNPLYTVKFLRNPLSQSRFTVVVSTKVSKKAVVRNRIKRVLREFIRLNLKSFVQGDYAIIVKPVATKKENPLLIKAFSDLVTSAKLFK